MQFGSAVINTQKFARLAKQFGEEQAVKLLRDEQVNNPDERTFYEEQNALAYNAKDRGARVTHGGVTTNPFGGQPSMAALFDAGQQNRASALDASDANSYAANYQDRRRGR